MSVNVKTITTCGDHILVAKTCMGCGHLKSGSEYLRRAATARARAHYDSSCRSCATRTANESMRRANEESLEKATNYRDVWTKDEVATLVRLADLGLSTREIAERLGRTLNGVFNKLSHVRNLERTDPGVHLFYYEPRTGNVRQVGKPCVLARKGHAARLNKAAQELSELHPQLIFFIQVDEGGEYMGIRGLDALKQGDDREPEDTSEDLEALATAGNS